VSKDSSRYVVDEVSLKKLKLLLDAINWGVIIGLPFKMVRQKRLADASVMLRNILGPRLIAIQLGNEPDFYVRQNARPKDWTFSHFDAEWRTAAKEIRLAYSDAPFAGPDVAKAYDWISPFGPNVDFLTSHYYPLGPAESPSVTQEALLYSAARSLKVLQKLGHLNSRPSIITECNSCYGGGRRGVSDAYSSAVWAFEIICLALATKAVQSICFHNAGNSVYNVFDIHPDRVRPRPIFYGIRAAVPLLTAEPETYYVGANGEAMSWYRFSMSDGAQSTVLINRAAQDREIAPPIEMSTSDSLWSILLSATENGQTPLRRDDRQIRVGAGRPMIVPSRSAVICTKI
jgi:hypothetical protein